MNRQKEALSHFQTGINGNLIAEIETLRRSLGNERLMAAQLREIVTLRDATIAELEEKVQARDAGLAALKAVRRAPCAICGEPNDE